MRSYYLATALVKEGVHVKVITGSNGKSYRKEMIDGIEVHYLPIAYDNHFGFYRRGLSFIRYLRESFRLAKSFDGIDVCYAMSVPLTVGVVAMWLKAKKNIPFIFEVGDLWPDAPIEMGFVRNPALKAFLLKLESRIYKSASSVVALSPAIRDAVKRKHPEAVVHLIPNISDISFFSLSPTSPGRNGKFVISYLGAIGVANGLIAVLRCAEACGRAHVPVHFKIAGAGAERALIENEIKMKGMTNVTLYPFQDRAGVREILNESDAVFVSYRPYKILETGSPNKYFDGLAAGKLIIVNFSGWIREEIEKSGCGVYVSPHDGVDIIAKLRPFLDPSRLQSAQEASRKLAEAKYSRDMLGNTFYQMIRELSLKVNT